VAELPPSAGGFGLRLLGLRRAALIGLSIAEAMDGSALLFVC